MGLRSRLFALSVPVLLLVIGAIWLLSHSILLDSFDKLDEEKLKDSARQLQRGLQQELLPLAQLSRDWAWWDDSAEFMQHPSQAFIDANLEEVTLSTLNLNFILFFDRQGKLVQAQWSNPNANDLPKQLDYQQLQTKTVSVLGSLGLTTLRLNAEDTRSSMFSVEGMPVFATSTPITDSAMEIEPLGTLVMGSYATPSRLQEIQERLLIPFELKPALSHQPDFLTLEGNSPIAGLSAWLSRRSVSEDRQQINLTLLAIDQQPALTLQLTRERPTFQQGKQLINLFFAGILLILVIASLLGYLIIERWLIGRLSQMNQQVALIGKDCPEGRLAEHGKDELAQLAAEINLMLERIEQGEFRDQAILDNIQDGFFEIDAKGLLQKANPALENMLDYAPGSLKDQPMQRFLDEETLEHTLQQFQRPETRRGQQTITVRISKADGGFLFVEARISEIRQSDGQLLGYRGIVRDVSNQIVLHSQLLDMAYRDTLTGLGNRKAFEEQLAVACRAATDSQQTLALFFIDLDRFKEVNDRFGHDTGDALLKCIAERLRDNLRGPDRLYRLGGDEFTLLMPGATESSARLMAERLMGVMQSPIKLEQVSIDFVGISIGIALYPEQAKDAADLLRAADLAMYQAKQRRGRAHLYTPQQGTDHD